MEWISVKDKLPEKEKNVLYCDIETEIYLGMLIDGMDKEIYWSHYDYLEDHDITHWMPLPNPPEKQNGMD